MARWSRTLIRLLSLRFLNKDKRREFRLKAENKILRQLSERTRWGVSYSVFDGQELLEASLKCVRAETDYINVVYQAVSWYGQPADPGLLPLLKKLQNDGLIDELIEFIPDPALKPRENEIKKRNLGLLYAGRAGCNYFMTLDCDEMFFPDEIKRAKYHILKNNITRSFCRLFIYGPRPTDLLITRHPAETSFIPFFSKIEGGSQLGSSKYTPCVVDPTRGVKGGQKEKYQVLNMVAMHHMLGVRYDMKGKIENSSSRELFGSSPKNLLSRFITVEVDDSFGIMDNWNGPFSEV